MAGTDTLGGPTGHGAVNFDEADRIEREIHSPPPRKSRLPLLLIVVLLLAAGAGAWYWWKSKDEGARPVVTAPPAPAPAAKAEAEEPTHYPAPVPAVPIPAPADAKPLPQLDQSDAAAREALAELIGSETVAKLLSTQDLIRHIVVTVDNLPRKTVAVRLNPVKPLGGEFRTAGSDAQRTIGPDNAARYTLYVHAMEQVDAKKVVAAYGRMYPLFQKAYEDLGYPKGYFNDRLIAVLDHLIATPQPSGPVAVVAPHVQYQYADPELESMSAGRKALVRMGPENAAAVKAKLREIRRELTKTGTGSAGR